MTTNAISAEQKSALAQAAADYLNSAVQADRVAIHALRVNRVPCNEAMLDHPHVVVDYNTLSSSRAVGALGLINGLLTSLGLPRMAADFEEFDTAKPNLVYLKGFVIAPAAVQPST